MATTRGKFSRWWNPDYEDDPTWQSQDEWYHLFKPEHGLDYDCALDVAKGRFQDFAAIDATLDKKAEWFFTLAVACQGGMLWAADKMHMHLWMYLPSLAMLVYSLACSARVKLPNDRPLPLTARDAVHGTENGENLSAWRAASLHCAATAFQVVTARKAKQIMHATVAIVAAIALLVVLYASPAVIRGVSWLLGR